MAASQKRPGTGIGKGGGRFREMFENSPFGIALVTPDYRFLAVNPAWVAMTGYTKDQLPVLSFSDIIIPDNPAGDSDPLRHLAKGHIPLYRAKIQCTRNDGSTFRAGLVVTAVRFKKGTVRYFIAQIGDISDQNAAETAHPESETLFRDAVIHLDVGYYRSTPEGVILWHNVAFNRILGIAPDRDMTGAFLPDFWQKPDDRKTFLDKLLSDGFVRNFPVSARKSDGLPITVIANAHVIRDAAGKTRWIEGTFSNITGLALTEKALQDEQDFTRMLLDAFPAYYVAIGADGRTITMNRALLEALEYTEDDVRGKDYLTTFVPEADRTNLIRVFSEIVNEGKGNVSINRVVSRSGREFLVEWQGRPVRPGQGKAGFFVGIGIDITERTRQERIIRAQLDLGMRLQKSRRMRETLEACLDTAIGISNLDSGGIYLVDEEKGTMDLVLAKNLSDNFVSSTGHYPLNSVNARLTLSGKPAYLTSTSIRGLISSENRDNEGIRALAVIPIHAGGKVIGSLNVSSHIYNEIPVASQISLETISTQVGTAIERILGDEALRESSRQLQEAQELAHLGFWTWDIKTGRVGWSAEVFRIFGLDPAVFVPQIDSILAFSPWPEDHERGKELIRRATESHGPGSYEQRFLRPDKSTGYYYSTFQGRYDESGSLVSIVGTIMDITERKRVETEIRNSRNFLDDIIEQSPNAIWISDEKGIMIRLNRACCSLFRIRPEEVIGRYNVLEDNIVREQGKMALVRSVFEEGRSVNFDLEYDSGALTTLPLERQVKVFLNVTIFPVRDVNGRITNAVVQHLDFSARKRAESALVESEERFRTLVEQLPIGIAMTKRDATGELVFFYNRSFTEITGYTRESVSTFDDWAALAYPDPDTRRLIYTGAEEMYAEAGLNVTSRPRTARVTCSDGTVRDLEFRYTDLKEFGFWSMSDVTDRLRSEELQAKLISELERKNAELERFAFTVSHDLKSPLVTIRGFTGLVEADAKKGDLVQLAKDTHRITEAADIMQTLLTELLQFSRIGKSVNTLRPTPFGTIAREAADLLAWPVADRGVRIEIDPDLPVVNVDLARIREALVNLIENAIKFFGSQPDPVIRIGALQQGEEHVFFVQDNGKGINPRYLDRIFNLFERLDVSVHGTGIGLPITRRIIEVHGGKIWAESEGEGRGTTFYFTLPVFRDSDPGQHSSR